MHSQQPALRSCSTVSASQKISRRPRPESCPSSESRFAISPADMSKAESIADMIAMALETIGRLDILVNNAGIQHVAPLEQFPIAKWDAILAISLSSAFQTARAALPSMHKNKFGRIINIAAAHGLGASPFNAAYVAAKHGIV